MFPDMIQTARRVVDEFPEVSEVKMEVFPKRYLEKDHRNITLYDYN